MFSAPPCPHRAGLQRCRAACRGCWEPELKGGLGRESSAGFRTAQEEGSPPGRRHPPQPRLTCPSKSPNNSTGGTGSAAWRGTARQPRPRCQGRRRHPRPTPNHVPAPGLGVRRAARGEDKPRRTHAMRMRSANGPAATGGAVNRPRTIFCGSPELRGLCKRSPASSITRCSADGALPGTNPALHGRSRLAQAPATIAVTSHRARKDHSRSDPAPPPPNSSRSADIPGEARRQSAAVQVGEVEWSGVEAARCEMPAESKFGRDCSWNHVVVV